MEHILTSYPALLTFISAELLCLLVLSGEIRIICKRPSQRSSSEQKQVERGLPRSILLELLLFVPVSVALALLVVRPLLKGMLPQLSLFQEPATFYSLLGVASYGFPFATVKRAVTRMALRTLSEFASVVHEQEATKPEK